METKNENIIEKYLDCSLSYSEKHKNCKRFVKERLSFC